MAFRPSIHRIRLTLAACAVLALGACSSDDELEYRELTVYEIYSQATEYLEDGRFRDASLYYDEVERQHPYSVWATKSKLMAAYSHYMNNKYDDATASLDRFIQVHPGNRDVVYAYYLKALCFYEQISDVQRDQDMTQQALVALEDVINRFPGTAYARDARLKIDLTRDHLAGKEMAVGRFYLQRQHYLASINRFKSVVEDYGNTTHAPEALFRLTEAYTSLGLGAEAKRAAAVLGHNYPGSDWYEDAYRLAGVDRSVRDERRQAAQAAEDDKPWWSF
ncbi:MAG: outer membrane protein assembly factor BamD [Alphaproteobacteria bacterium]|nr:outer membrane protein assembly factor BamD [Alphaproteobacteria bacterium]